MKGGKKNKTAQSIFDDQTIFWNKIYKQAIKLFMIITVITMENETKQKTYIYYDWSMDAYLPYSVHISKSQQLTDDT